MQNLIATTFEVVHYIALQAVHYKPLQEVHLSRYNHIYGAINYPYGYDMDYYWVIDKTNDTIQGPLDSSGFYRYIQMKNIKCKLKQ